MALSLTVIATSSADAMRQDDAPEDIHEHNQPATRRDRILSAVQALPLAVDIVEVVFVNTLGS